MMVVVCANFAGPVLATDFDFELVLLYYILYLIHSARYAIIPYTNNCVTNVSVLPKVVFLILALVRAIKVSTLKTRTHRSSTGRPSIGSHNREALQSYAIMQSTSRNYSHDSD